MKRIFAALLCALAAFSLTACGTENSSSAPESAASSNGAVSSSSAVSSVENIFSEVSAADEKTELKSLVLLGDSIATGCMLPDYEPGNNYSAPLSFGNMLGAEFESYKNFAVDGRTTEELLSSLEADDAELSEALSSADVIVISIGGNDFLQPMITAIRNDETLDYLFEESGGELSDEDFRKALDASLEAAKAVDVSITFDNIGKCAAKITEINPTTKIILMTVYDPFSGSEELKAASDVAREKLTVLNFGLSSLGGGNIGVIDVYAEFDGAAEKLTNIGSMDIHPNSDGHYRIYRLLKKQLGI
ncbi:MAG: SGNH/GDSL hydrolase family protein [Oscillospiraceae bacterium]|nr:SGNH/GDSL hydrolase family protein [Oscillospiraceae bacterium]